MSDADLHAQRTDRFDLRALYETSRILSSSLDLEFVLNNLLLTAMSKLLVMRGAAFLYDPLLRRYRTAACSTSRRTPDNTMTGPGSCRRWLPQCSRRSGTG